MDNDTLPQWLHRRYGVHAWDEVHEDERLYWRHEADAVRRAVARNGFKTTQTTTQRTTQ